MEFKYILFGGSGNSSNSSEMGGGFDDGDSGKGSDNTRSKYPAEFNVGGKNRSYDKTLSLFNKKYANADHEYAVTVDSQGFVTTHLEGNAHSVSLGKIAKGETVIHNHPSAGNFSKQDLVTISKSEGSSIVATGTKKTYRFTKTHKFKSEEFQNALNKAEWPKNLDYNSGADWWLRKNAKTYGYKYSAKKTKY